MNSSAEMILVKWNKMRKFGIEFEFVSDDRNHREFLKNIISNSLRDQGMNHHRAQVRDWEHTIDNDCIWVCKTDSSCGYEVCTPPLRGPNELKVLGKVIDALKENGARFDERCGLHVHLSLSDFTEEQMYVMLMYWVKIEHNVMNAHPEHRRRNTRYCPTAISRIQDWEAQERYSGYDLYRILRRHRGAINPSYWEQRKTIEWRMGEMSLDSESIKNRIRFLIWFVDVCKCLQEPPNLDLIDPKNMMLFLALMEDKSGITKTVFSPAIKSMRKWILDRMAEYTPTATDDNIRDKQIAKDLLKEQENSESINISMFSEEE